MQTTFTLKKVVAHPYCSMVSALAIFFVLPRFGAMAVVIGCAGVLSALVAAQPESFRTRGGSMRLAICLVAAMWVVAAIVSLLTLAGALRD